MEDYFLMMNPIYYLRSLQNSASLAIRDCIRFSMPVADGDPLLLQNLGLQREFLEFLGLFNWAHCELGGRSGPYLMADIGCRDFSFAPVYEDWAIGFGLDAEIHGVEVDGFRRYSNFRTRADYGRFYAAKLKKGFYHPGDFLRWNRNVDLFFLLHPFVTPEPPVRWGLPLSVFKPQQLFDHAFELLKPNGLMLLSNPTERESEISEKLALESGFVVIDRQKWLPRPDTRHQRPRIGILLGKK